ncbi:hypothetical protein BGZ47_001492, partial [Haplosporangium gracile]
MAPAIVFLRSWMAFVALVNLSIIIAFYGWLIPTVNKAAEETEDAYRYEFYWGDYALIISSVLLLPAYLYSIWGKKSLVSNKYTRAVLMLLPALFLIGVQLRQIDLTIKFIKMSNARKPELFRNEPFSCANSDGSIAATCGLVQSQLFVPVIVGFFALIEVA